MKNTSNNPLIKVDLKKNLASLIGNISPILNSNFSSLFFNDSGNKINTRIIEITQIPAAKKKGAAKFIDNNNPPITGPNISPAPKTALEYPKVLVLYFGLVTSLIYA